jgi:hypothetical protein
MPAYPRVALPSTDGLFDTTDPDAFAGLRKVVLSARVQDVVTRCLAPVDAEAPFPSAVLDASSCLVTLLHPLTYRS